MTLDIAKQNIGKILSVVEKDIGRDDYIESIYEMVKVTSIEENVIVLQINDVFKNTFKQFYKDTFNELFKGVFGNDFKWKIDDDNDEPKDYILGKHCENILTSIDKTLKSNGKFHNEFVFCKSGVGRTKLINYISQSHHQCQKVDFEKEINNIKIENNCKILLIDNFELIRDKNVKIEEIIKLINSLNSNKKSVYIFCNIYPKDFFNEKLFSFVENFDKNVLFFPTRSCVRSIIALLFKKYSSLLVSDDAIDYISKLDNGEDLHVLEGFVTRIIFNKDNGKKNILTVKDVMKIFKETNSFTHVNTNLISSICEYHKIDEKLIYSNKRTNNIKLVRNGIVFILHKFKKQNFKGIASLLHKSVSYVSNAYKRVLKNKVLAQQWEKIYNSI